MIKTQPIHHSMSNDDKVTTLKMVCFVAYYNTTTTIILLLLWTALQGYLSILRLPRVANQ